jgi:hypothetical protein
LLAAHQEEGNSTGFLHLDLDVHEYIENTSGVSMDEELEDGVPFLISIIMSGVVCK